jgi:hypothetical protein
MTVRIIGGTIRDLSYIAANLRPEDHAEVDCQFDSWTPAQLALSAMQGYAYVAEIDGNPEAAFGAGELRSGLWIIWCWGSKRMGRCVPRITKFCLESLMPDVLDAGALRGEARPMASNASAIRWLERLGATRQGTLRNYGKNGEDFELFEWVRSPNHPVSAKVNRPDGVFSALTPGLHRSLKGGRDDTFDATTQRLPAAMLPV